MSSSATTTDDRQQSKRQPETQLEGDLKRQKKYDFENPKLPTSTVNQCPTGQGSTQAQSNRKHVPTTTSRQPTPTTTSSPDLRQHPKRPLDTLVKGGPKRQKTPDIVIKTSPGTTTISGSAETPLPIQTTCGILVGLETVALMRGPGSGILPLQSPKVGPVVLFRPSWKCVVWKAS